MADKEMKRPIRIELTAEQKEQIRELIGKEASTIEIKAEELEERIAPGIGRRRP